MDSLLHTGGTLLTILFIAAVLYSLLSSFRKKRKKAARQKDLETKQHVQIENLHQYDVQPQKGYYAYPIDASDALRRYPQQFTALSLVLANEQPYSVCLIGFAEFEKGQLKNTHYFYVRPPENDITNKKYPELTWDVLRKADEFGEYWEAGMKDYFVGRTLVAHNASFVMGCIAHALKIYGIDAPCLRFIDTMEVAKTLYHFPSNKLTAISEEMNIEMDEQNALSAAMAAGQFLIKAKQDYPLYLPNIHFAYGMPTQDERLAAVVAAVEREECTAEEIFAPNPADMDVIQTLLDKKYIEHGDKEGTYYATDAGLDFSESLP